MHTACKTIVRNARLNRIDSKSQDQQFIFARSHDRVLRQFESGEVQREKRCVGNNAEKFGTRAINQRAVTLGHRIESSRTEAR